jgi:NADPH2:quinone reductase
MNEKERRCDMKAMVIVQTKEGGRLEWHDVPEPEPGPGELLMRVKATAVNHADLYQLRGTYDPTQKPADRIIAGLEAAGEVAAIGKDVSGFAKGDRIMGTCRGGYAEFTTLDHRLAIPVPERLSWEEAATIPVAYMTEHNALITNGRLKAGETVLVNAASSGVGVAAIQIAKFCGAKIVIGTASTPKKLAALTTLGMDLGINYRTENFADAVLAATNGTGADVVIDHVGGPYLKENLRCMALKGRLVSVGRLGGTTAELDLELIAYKRLQLIGVTFRTRTMDERIAIAQGVVADLLPALADGRLRPVIDRIFPLHQAAEAQAYMESNAQIGKIVLKV